MKRLEFGHLSAKQLSKECRRVSKDPTNMSDSRGCTESCKKLCPSQGRMRREHARSRVKDTPPSLHSFVVLASQTAWRAPLVPRLPRATTTSKSMGIGRRGPTACRSSPLSTARRTPHPLDDESGRHNSRFLSCALLSVRILVGSIFRRCFFPGMVVHVWWRRVRQQLAVAFSSNCTSV